MPCQPMTIPSPLNWDAYLGPTFAVADDPVYPGAGDLWEQILKMEGTRQMANNPKAPKVPAPPLAPPKNQGERAKRAGVKARYMQGGHWTPREMRKKR